MKPFRVLITGLGCALLSVTYASAEEAAAFRVWTNTAGRQVEATFVGLEGDKISIQNKAGQIFSLPISSLSSADQEYAKTAKPAVTYIAENASIGQAAAAIDKLVMKGLENGAAKIAKNNAAIMSDSSLSEERKKSDVRPVPKPNPLMSDEQFVRRVYLDIAGRIPNHDEAKSFLTDSSPTKRAKLIDLLLESPGYNSHMYNYIAEMLRVRDRLEQDNLRGIPYINWLQKCVSDNMPWDQMVQAMMTAEGKMWHEGKGAAGYLLRDAGMPLDNLANTLAVFLGTDVSCAQCHDHPFADWTQRQFYEMAAFFGSTTTNLVARRGKKDKGLGMMASNYQERIMPQVEQIISSSGGDIARVRNAIQVYMGANRYGVQTLAENTLALPHDYKYSDGKPNERVNPKLITWSESDKNLPAYKETGNSKNAEKIRDKFAAWMTHPSNPRFAMSIANRMWKRAFGLAVSEPVTNIDDPKKASNPELLQHLAKEMVRVKFNLKEFMRIVYNTQSYQREATTDPVPMGEAYYFQGPVLRRMSAEQAWDSYMTLVLGEPDKYTKPLDDLYSRSIDLDLTNEKLDGKTVLLKFDAYRRMAQKERELTGGGLDEAESMMMSEGKGKKKPATETVMESTDGPKSLKFGNQVLRRAAELEQPATGGSFLSEFGQSQRLLIDGGSKEGSVPQVLMLMNGDGQKMLTDTGSLIYRTMEKVTSPADKVEVVFMSILNRKPSLAEKDIAKRGMEGSGDEGYSNLIWALINTREFMFIQ
jgi:hypothetical protein